ncbi:MAG TPA: c-type cytochrome [Longimicrobiales bacterium]|nr:c-type cytochrome [Longimicrobiales bacterium]
MTRGRDTGRRGSAGLPLRLATAAIVAATLGACQEHEIETPSRAERVEEAEAIFDPAMFDTIAWADPELRIQQGNAVYAAECRRCHGTLGEGDTEYAREHGLDVPSLVKPDWEYAGDPAAVRRRIFIGHEAGMPTWGVAGITPREIDAVAAYVTEDLRPEVLGAGSP